MRNHIKKGDQVLQKISEILLGSLRTFDVVSRWGGEEFLIILPGCEKRDLYHTLERLMTAVRNLKMKKANHHCQNPIIKLGHPL